jgi:hypothetical protein
MNPNWQGVISALLAFVCFLFAYRVAAKAKTKTRLFFGATAIVLAIPGASFAGYYAHVFREPSWYYQFRSVSGTELLIVFVGVAGGIAASILPRILLVFPLLGVAAFAIAPIVKPIIGPIPEGTLGNEWDDGVCLQSTPSTGGAAAVATILKDLGEDTKESELAAEAHSYIGGTEAWYLARTVRSRGFDVRFDFALGFKADADFPAVVGVRLDSVGHFIPILRREGDQFLVGDPLRGRELLSREELLQRYDFTGFYMLIGNKGEQDVDPII